MMNIRKWQKKIKNQWAAYSDFRPFVSPPQSEHTFLQEICIGWPVFPTPQKPADVTDIYDVIRIRTPSKLIFIES